MRQIVYVCVCVCLLYKQYISDNTSENEELLREMTTRASKPTPEVYLMQKEVEKVRNEMKQERSIFEHLKSNLEKRYQDEVSGYVCSVNLRYLYVCL